MQAIRTKIFIVIILLIAAMLVSAAIYTRGGFSLTSQEDQQGFCGTVSNAPLITNTHGRDLFLANCASCHSIHKDMTGPALAGYEKHFPVKLLYLFLRQPQKAYKKSKYLQHLKEQYDQTEHFAFPSLGKAEVDDISNYISEVARKNGN